MSESTARDDDSKIPPRVRSAQVVSLGSYSSSAKSPITQARKSERVPIRRPHFEYVPQRGNHFDRCKKSNSRVVGGCHRTRSADRFYFLEKWTGNFNCTALLVNRKLFLLLLTHAKQHARLPIHSTYICQGAVEDLRA